MNQAVQTVDDVTRAVDNLAAEVVWMDLPESQRQAVLDALQQALKLIQSHAMSETMETAQQAIADFLRAVDRGYLGQMPSGFNESAFVKALRAQIETNK
jgi:hypothetical protein